MEQLLFDFKVALRESEVMAGYFVLVAGSILAVPVALIGELFKKVSEKLPYAMPPERLPVMLAALGSLLGWMIAKMGPLWRR